MRIADRNTVSQPSPGKPDGAIRVSPALVDAARQDPAEVLRTLDTSPSGLTSAEAARRLARFGPNAVAQEKRRGPLWRLLVIARGPLVILLSVLAVVAFATEDPRSGLVISLMIAIGVGLRFVQESRADDAAARLTAMIRVTATALRDGDAREVPLHDLVPGDVVRLSAGDIIPADIRLLATRNLCVDQASLTGESFPVDKSEGREEREGPPPLEIPNLCFLGTSVESGTASAVVVETGPRTYFGSMASHIVGPPEETSFDRGINRFTWLMIRFILVMVPLVFVINGVTKHDWKESFFFAMAIAVGLTPEMLPMIVSTGLAKGALAMSRKKVIVKRLNAIQNLGAMDVLCTDKTGTLTLDRVILERHCDVIRREDDAVLADAYVISHFQTGLKNVLDRAILAHRELHELRSVDEYRSVDELPFDYSRRMMSVVVDTPSGGRRILAKGAPEEVFRRCTRAELDGEMIPMEGIVVEDLKEEYDKLSTDGFRVLAVATKDVERRPSYSLADESELVLKGYVAFLDPPKETASAAIRALRQLNVEVKVLTGDNELVSRKVCREVGLPVEKVLLGTQVETLSDGELAVAARQATLLARLSPAHKERVIRALRADGHVVGFMGDGINDAPSLRAADVGISVDSAVDVAKESADILLLEKSLTVLGDGVLEGRKVFANILKYIRMGASSNFGNMFSVLGASAFLPFVPMAPIQVLTNNLLYDFSQIPIPSDNVDAEQIARPRPWSIDEIRRFILFIGPISSIFDYATYFVMLYVFHCWDPARASLFHTGWFVESLMTQTLIIHIIRTNRIPFFESRANWPLILTSGAIMAAGAWLPHSPMASALGFVPLPPLYWPILAATLLLYCVLTHVAKRAVARSGWI